MSRRSILDFFRNEKSDCNVQITEFELEVIDRLLGLEKKDIIKELKKAKKLESEIKEQVESLKGFIDQKEKKQESLIDIEKSIYIYAKKLSKLESRYINQITYLEIEKEILLKEIQDPHSDLFKCIKELVRQKDKNAKEILLLKNKISEIIK